MNYRLLIDPYSHESRIALAYSGGNEMDEDYVIVQLYIIKI